MKILIFLLALSFFSNEFEFSFKRFAEESLGVMLYLSVLIAGIFYSQDKVAGLSVLETNFSFIGICLLICRYKKFSSETLSGLFVSFVGGVLLACIICVVNAAIRFQRSSDFNVFFSNEFTRIIDSHPTYLAYYIIFSIAFVLNYIAIKCFSNRYWIYALITLFLFLILVLTGGRTAFISLLLICSFFVLNSILGKRSLESSWASIIAIILIIGMFGFTFVDYSFITNHSSNDTSFERFKLWKAVINANPNIIFGVGTGDYKDVMNNYYASHNMNEFAAVNFNSHNEFLQILFSNGLVGLFTVLFLIGRPLYLAVKKEHSFGILVFFPFLIYGVTEVFLGRYQGVIFFALLQQIFVSYYNQALPSLVLKKGLKPTIKNNVAVI